MERHLTEHFAGTEGREVYGQLVRFSPVLSAFPAASDLVAYLHSEQSSGNGNLPKDKILAELLRVCTTNSRASTAREFLLLVFVPMLHRISRQVLTRCPALSRDDVAQHVLTALLESLGSLEFVNRDSHIAFALRRLLRRNAFVWADRESRGWLQVPNGAEALEHSPQPDGSEPIERAAFLRHFLDRCQKRGVLSDDDLELLVQFKFDEPPGMDYSNASRQRMKRLVGKLRLAARRPRQTKSEDRQLRLF
jgi:hypothetical protein